MTKLSNAELTDNLRAAEDDLAEAYQRYINLDFDMHAQYRTGDLRTAKLKVLDKYNTYLAARKQGGVSGDGVTSYAMVGDAILGAQELFAEAAAD